MVSLLTHNTCFNISFPTSALTSFWGKLSRALFSISGKGFHLGFDIYLGDQNWGQFLEVDQAQYLCIITLICPFKYHVGLCLGNRLMC